ncbi:MAG: response regulator [Gemmatimonadaceae bacterium]|jgi:CheY-like chemotaxis protein/anti-sigma regulatory factor (Ser/Thr protein kinase)|nr:response regulator [Gemmatimonadaceae bacterium]
MDTLVPSELEVPWRHAEALRGAAELASAVARRLRSIAEALPADVAARADVEAYADRLGALGGESATLMPIPVHRWLAECCTEWRSRAEESGVRLLFEPALVDADGLFDAERLRLALDEVVANAVRAAAQLPADLVRAVTVRVEHVASDGAEIGPVPPLEAGSYLRITVADTGPGMDSATRTRAPHPADGLGLAIAYGAVRQAGGALWIDSTEGWGTRVFLFVRKVPAPTVRTARDVVLVVEDEAQVRVVVRRLLAGQGFEVLESSNGRDALEVLHRHQGRVGAVVTDVVMPVMGGRDLVKAIREMDDGIPVICMSGFADQERLLDGIGPAVPLIEKPFTSQQLIATLRGALGATAH